jgi:hypothetical protein
MRLFNFGRESVVVSAHVDQNLFHSLVVSGRLYLYGRELSCAVCDIDVKVSDFYLVAFLVPDSQCSLYEGCGIGQDL